MNCELHQHDNLSGLVPKSQGRSLRRNFLSVLTACVLFVLFVLNLRYPIVRFTVETFNIVCFVVAVFLPAFAAIGVLRLSSACTQKWIGVAIQTMSALLVVVTVLFGIFALVFGANGWRVFRARLLTPSFTVTAYADGDGIEVYQERILLPGIALVRRLDSVSDADQPKVESVDKGHARVTLTIYEHQTSRTHEDIRLYDLKPFIYF